MDDLMNKVCALIEEHVKNEVEALRVQTQHSDLSLDMARAARAG